MTDATVTVTNVHELREEWETLYADASDALADLRTAMREDDPELAVGSFRAICVALGATSEVQVELRNADAWTATHGAQLKRIHDWADEAQDLLVDALGQ